MKLTFHARFCSRVREVTFWLRHPRSHVFLFSSDLELESEKIIDYYRLRFQIEFNFRDAKQFLGLEDFMNLSQTAVTNAANLAFFMVNLSHHLLSDFRQQNPDSALKVAYMSSLNVAIRF